MNVYAGHNGRGDRPTTGNVHVVPGGSRISSICRPFRAQVVMLDYEIVEVHKAPRTELLFLSWSDLI